MSATTVDYRLHGRVALVTGAGSGIGEACARTLAASGADVVVADVDRAAAGRVADSIGAAGGRASAFVLDVAVPDSVTACVAAAEERGPLEIAVNNAGIGLPATATADLDLAAWRQVMDVNLDGLFTCLRAELAVMAGRGRGAIVVMASVLGAVASETGTAAYTASKHAAVGLARQAAVEYAARGIRVNAVCPGYIATPLVLERLSDEARRARAAVTPLGRLGSPAEVAEQVAWLCSDAASYVTGSAYAVDGGFLAR